MLNICIWLRECRKEPWISGLRGLPFLFIYYEIYGFFSKLSNWVCVNSFTGSCLLIFPEVPIVQLWQTSSNRWKQITQVSSRISNNQYLWGITVNFLFSSNLYIVILFLIILEIFNNLWCRGWADWYRYLLWHSISGTSNVVCCKRFVLNWAFILLFSFSNYIFPREPIANLERFIWE